MTKTSLWLRHCSRQFGRPPQRLRSSSSKHLRLCILCSSGRSHAHAMSKILICDFIAQQCSVLASFSLMVLFIARDKTRLWLDELRYYTKLSFSVWQEDLRPLLTRDPAVYGVISLTLRQRALRTTTTIKRTLYGSASSLHPLGSVSWCTRYGSACKMDLFQSAYISVSCVEWS
jgi:hypothetical protein